MCLSVLLCLFTDEYSQPFVLAASIIIILFSFIRLIIEIIQIYYRYHRYFLEVENWLQLCSFVSSILFVPYGLQSGCQCPESWQWQFGAFAMCVSWLLLVLFLKEFPLTGIYVEMFIHIIFTFMKLFLFALLLVISFGLTFYMIFFRPVSYISLHIFVQVQRKIRKSKSSRDHYFLPESAAILVKI